MVRTNTWKHLSIVAHPDRGLASILLVLVLLTLSLSSLVWSKEFLRYSHKTAVQSLKVEPLYLPSEKTLKLITLGFNNFAGDILWFNTVSYFGREYESTRDYRWLAHMCNLVTALDPKAAHVYEFCSTMLSWVAKRPEDSAALLQRGVEALPNYWRLRYLLGFTDWYFLERKDLALVELEKASHLPDVPPFVTAMASRLMVSEEDPQTAISFLNDMIKNAKDDYARNALNEKLRLAKISLDISNIKKAISLYEAKNGQKVTDLNQLTQAKIIKGRLEDPYGGSYFLDPQSGEIKTTSGKKGLSFTGKTAKTGLVKKEWKDS